jgi:hypothetical protein
VKSKRTNNSVFFMKAMSRQPGGGHPTKWNDLSEFIASKVRDEWEKGMPICTKELFVLFQHNDIHSEDDEAIKLFVDGKKNTIHKFIG